MRSNTYPFVVRRYYRAPQLSGKWACSVSDFQTETDAKERFNSPFIGQEYRAEMFKWSADGKKLVKIDIRNRKKILQ